MRTTKFIAAIAAASLLSAPVLAAGSASKLSLGSDVRAGKAMTHASKQDESSGGLIIAAGAAAAVILAVVLISDGDDENDLPTSP